MTEHKAVGFSYNIIGDVNENKCVEPEKRWVGGEYGWAVHRFPIKGGITKREMTRRMLMDSMYEARNTMLIDLFSKAEPTK